MNTVAYVFGIVVALAVLLSISEMLRRRRVRERHAVWWLAAGLVALVVAVFPGLLIGVASALGITVPTNLGFFLAIIVLFLVSVSQSAELTVLESKTRVLAENVALLEERIVRLEQGGRGADRSAEQHPSTTGTGGAAPTPASSSPASSSPASPTRAASSAEPVFLEPAPADAERRTGGTA